MDEGTVHVKVATELLPQLGKWSAPVQVKVISDGTRYDMIFRRVENYHCDACADLERD